MRGYVDRIRGAGAELYVVGNGNAAQAKAFAAEQDVSFPLYTDPSLATYEAAGFRNEIKVNPKVLWRSMKAMAEGHFQTLTQGTTSQNGGAYVFDRGGEELFAFVSADASDHPDPERFLEALARRD